MYCQLNSTQLNAQLDKLEIIQQNSNQYEIRMDGSIIF